MLVQQSSFVNKIHYGTNHPKCQSRTTKTKTEIDHKERFRANRKGHLLDHAKIRNGAGQLDVPVLGGRHGQVNAEQACRENQENAHGSGEFPAIQREPIWLRLLGGRRVIVIRLGVLLVPQQPPALAHQTPRRSHDRQN